MIWKQINHPDILSGYLISPDGYVKASTLDDKDAFTASYHSTNGYDFILLNNKDMKLQLFPLDDIIAMAYIPIPESLKDKRIKVSHINGDTRDISLDNLQWVEDIEEWKIVDDPRVLSNRYKVSNFGNIVDIVNNSYINKHINGSGYYNVNLLRKEMHRKRRFITVLLHGLVAKTFLVVRYDVNDVVNHIDGLKINNYFKNLEYVSQEMNTKHAMETYLKNHVSEETINYIRNMLDKWKCPRLVYKNIDSEHYPHINMNLITNIKRNHYYDRGIPHNHDYHPGKMTVEEIDMVRDLILDSVNHNCIIAYNKIDHDKYPHITLQMVKEIKTNKYSSYNKSNKYDLSKLKFLRTPPPCKLSLHQIDDIRDALVKYDGNCKKVFEVLRDKIPSLSINMIYDIKRGKSYKRSNKYDLTIDNKFPFTQK